jgi:hypothetical protein
MRTFSKLAGSTYPCDVCGRRTRYTGVQSVGNKLCPQCYDLAGIENEVSDGHTTVEESRATVDALIRDIESKGGNAADWHATFQTDRRES